MRETIQAVMAALFEKVQSQRKSGRFPPTKILAEMRNHAPGMLQISQMTKADDVRILSKDPVFVTAFSDNHFDDAIKGVVKTFEYLGAKFYVYDLGLNKKNLAAVSDFFDIRTFQIFILFFEQIRSIPSVIAVKKFNFSAYPRYARHLYEYRWKAMLLAVCKDASSAHICDSFKFPSSLFRKCYKNTKQFFTPMHIITNARTRLCRIYCKKFDAKSITSAIITAPYFSLIRDTAFLLRL